MTAFVEGIAGDWERLHSKPPVANLYTMKTFLRLVMPSLLLVGPLSGAQPSEGPLAPLQQELLSDWFAAAEPRPNEDFGEFVARVARLKQGVAYDNQVLPPGDETLRVDLSSFECVSFIESSLALARCAWVGEKNQDCFQRELLNHRYRDGRLDGYASRLHYFTEWIQDNRRRENLEELTGSLGGEPTSRDFYYMTRLNQAHFDKDDPQAARLREVEDRLSQTKIVVLDRERAADGIPQVESGDVIAFIRSGPGLAVRHAGFAWKDPSSGEIRLLHASSYHERVVLTASDLLDYLTRRPERKGIMVARPLAP